MKLLNLKHKYKGGRMKEKTTEKITTMPQNPLGTERIGRLLIKYSIPAIISMVVNAIYNLADQIFIGWGVGELGIAATNVAFPLTTICVAVGSLFGIGGASNLSLFLGKNDTKDASLVVGNTLTLLTVSGLLIGAIAAIFLEPMLKLFGSTEAVMVYAEPYTFIIALGLPLMIVSIGLSNLIRADGSPTYSMICMFAGAIFNIIFDPIFLFVLDMGIEGIALATVLGQLLSTTIGLVYVIKKFKSVRPGLRHLKLSPSIIKLIASLGAAACANQLAMTVVQIITNNTLTYYGAQTVYGSDIPLAAVGAVSKVTMLFMAIVIGTAQGSQPIAGFNYGAKNFRRVKKTYKVAITFIIIYSVISFACFQLFPAQIVSIFGSGSELYNEFAVKYMRYIMMFAFAIGFQAYTSNFFTAIGKPVIGLILTMTRQIIFLIPLMIILPMFFGLNGALYAMPLSDAVATGLTLFFIVREMKKMTKAQKELEADEDRILIDNQVVVEEAVAE